MRLASIFVKDNIDFTFTREDDTFVFTNEKNNASRGQSPRSGKTEAMRKVWDGVAE